MSKIVYKAHRFRLYPNKTQRVQMAKTFGSVRFVYNHFLDAWTPPIRPQEKAYPNQVVKRHYRHLKLSFPF
ncbi:helix-turn-helix domain-containing protein [Metalysinibacillus jejuensis]|uniref:helix-turn-helix domain-containing protein n=1 Tax=Metalysinibacillus jejuensis TaxID=914327 RepID=UPI000D3B27C5|nr:helix-turn-helix domain-containing protein [Metalysinibacillus jejuensis]